ncbi:type II toxin-antitoxin system VapC family toxin [Candidatus Woesearchaeota archaeon]|nr:type II toxin-antitoxin system VapC family toxin [Candidatus Woesearchaeota archaeon]
MKLYIESSVINFAFAADDLNRVQITQKFFEVDIKKHEPFISELVLEEIEKTPGPKREKMSNFVLSHGFRVLPNSEEAEKLASKYVKAGLIPEKYLNDAIHIALASVNKIEVLVSWNMEHIVKLKTIVGVNKINKEEGYANILINTPEEVLE